MIPRVIAAAGGGALLAFSFPPASYSAVALFALIPLLWAVEADRRPGWSLLYGMTFGAVFFALDVSWVYRTLALHGQLHPATAVLVFVGMVATLSLFPGCFGLAEDLLRRRGLPVTISAPFVWVAIEYARSVFFTGFPWDLIGYSQMPRELLIQIADLTGVYGVSFVVVLVNSALFELAQWIAGYGKARWSLPAACAVTVALAVVYGTVRLGHYPVAASSDRGCSIGILQGNIAQEVKWEKQVRNYTFLTYERLGRLARDKGADLLVWPETAVPVCLGSGDPDWDRAVAISSRLARPMVIGSPSLEVIDGKEHFYNSAFLVDGDGPLLRYDKVHLVPFGEYMPLTWLLPLGPGIAARDGDFSAGDSMTVMRLDGCPPFGVLICYEAIFPELARAAIGNGATLLMNLTNDAWFGQSAAPYQHVQLARMRSVENRVWMVRAANTGISAAFDPAGRVVASIPLGEEGFTVVTIPSTTTAGSFYSRFGDVFAWACILMCIASLIRPSRVSVGSKSRDAR